MFFVLPAPKKKKNLTGKNHILNVLDMLVREIAKPLLPSDIVELTVRMQMEMSKEGPITSNRPCRNRETQPTSYHIQSCQKDAQISPPCSLKAP